MKITLEQAQESVTIQKIKKGQKFRLVIKGRQYKARYRKDSRLLQAE